MQRPFGHAVGMTARIPIPDHLRDRAFTTRQGLNAGLSPDRLLGRDLHRPFHGVRSVAPVTEVINRCHAYTQRMPAIAFFCSATAALLLGAPLPFRLASSPILHIGVPAPHRAVRAAGVVGHKLQVVPHQIGRWHGLPVIDPELAWCQLGSEMGVLDLVAVGDHLIHWRSPVTTVGRLRRSLDGYPGRRGRPALRAAIELLNDRAESPQESRLRAILAQGNVRGVEVNLWIRASSGHNYRADLAIPSRKLILEYQGADHLHEERYRSDMTRISRLEADGWYVMQINANDLRNPTELLQRIQRVIRGRPVFT